MTSSSKITVLDSYPLNPGDIGWEPIESLGELTIYEATDEAQLAQHTAGAEILLTNKAPLREKDLPLIRNCKLIGVLATGVNVVDVKAMNKAGIKVCNVPNYGPDDVAQHTLALILELARHTALHTASVKNGEWGNRGWCYWLKPPRNLTGLTLGIAGFGSIGQMLGKYATALGMKVLALSRSRKAQTDYDVQFVNQNELFAKSDIISLHCPLTPETGKMINARTIAQMKPGAIIINTARGGIIDEEAVANALKSGQLGGFGADVLSQEPPEADNPLITAPNTLLTPHIAWATQRARQKIIAIMADNIQNFLAGNPKNLVV